MSGEEYNFLLTEFSTEDNASQIEFFTENNPWPNCTTKNKLYEKDVQAMKKLFEMMDNEEKKEDSHVTKNDLMKDDQKNMQVEAFAGFYNIISDSDENFPAYEIAWKIINNPEYNEKYEHLKSMKEPVQKLLECWATKRQQRYGYGTDIRRGIFFFLENGYFTQKFIDDNKKFFKMFVKLFNEWLKNLTPYVVQNVIQNPNDSYKRYLEPIFIDDKKQYLMILWTTLIQDIQGPQKSEFVEEYKMKLNIHTYILEKYYNGKISKMYMIRINDSIDEPQIVEVDRIPVEEIEKAMISYHN